MLKGGGGGYNIKLLVYFFGKKAGEGASFCACPFRFPSMLRIVPTHTKLTLLLPFKGIFCVLNVHRGSLSGMKRDIRLQG